MLPVLKVGCGDKEEFLFFFICVSYVWEDARVWGYWSHFFHMHLSYLGPASCLFTEVFSFLNCLQFSRSVAQSCPTLCDPMDCRTPGLPVHQQLPEFTLTHVHQVGDAIQPSHSLSSPSPPAFNLSQHQDLFKWVSSSHQVVKVLEFQLQHHSFQWIFRTDFL